LVTSARRHSTSTPGRQANTPAPEGETHARAASGSNQPALDGAAARLLGSLPPPAHRARGRSRANAVPNAISIMKCVLFGRGISALGSLTSRSPFTRRRGGGPEISPCGRGLKSGKLQTRRRGTAEVPWSRS
jgi:hypothetical protein